jgi:hypothetical protein
MGTVGDPDGGFRIIAGSFGELRAGELHRAVQVAGRTTELSQTMSAAPVTTAALAAHPECGIVERLTARVGRYSG